MPLSDIATITVTTTGAGVTRAGYGVPLILSHTAAWAERTRTYSSLAAVLVDFAANTPEYLAAAKIFGQSPKVARIVIGRAALVPTQRFAVGVQAAGATALDQAFALRVGVPTGVVFKSQDATYNSGKGATGWRASGVWSVGDLIVGSTGHLGLYVNLGQSGARGFGGTTGLTGAGSTMGPSGIGSAIQEGQVFWMYTGSGVTGGVNNDAIIVGLEGKILALQSPAVSSTGAAQLTTSIQGSQGSRTLRLLANTAGKFFAAQVYNRAALNIAQDHSDPGVATDLAAVKLASSAWYGLITLFNSEDLIIAAAAWVEANTKLYPAASLDSKIPQDAEALPATDIAHDIKAAAYARTWAFFHPSNDQFADAAELGKFFPISPGGETWRMKTLAGVTVETFTDTEITNMRDKYAAFYYDIGGVNVVGGDAKTGSGEYIDVTRFIDWYTSELQAKLANLVIGNDKIPFTDAGVNLVKAKVSAQNDAGIAAGGIRSDPAPVVSAPLVADVSDEDKLARELPDVETEWQLAGAIHHTTVRVTASP